MVLWFCIDYITWWIVAYIGFGLSTHLINTTKLQNKPQEPPLQYFTNSTFEIDLLKKRVWDINYTRHGTDLLIVEENVGWLT